MARIVDPSMWDTANFDERTWQMLLQGGTWRLEQFADFWCEASQFAAEIERWAETRGLEAETHVEGRVVYLCLGEEAEEARAARFGELDDGGRKLRAERWETQQRAWELDVSTAT
ncbi:hypothetical protein AB0M41_46840 [Streptomyces sp. NPDC051896]|uniref:hypothetical protein n=1 Tax=Streptomyces sp. NPDC051896 TaxID=3155416 RepID=UPI003425B550